jgi:coatomer subunit beta
VNAPKESSTSSKVAGPSLRNLIISGDFFLAVALSYTLAKLFIKCRNDNSLDQVTKNLIQSDVLLIMTSILRYGQSTKSPIAIDSDSQDRITTFMKVLIHPSSLGEEVLKVTHDRFVDLMKEQQKGKQTENKGVEVKSQVDDLLKIRQLQPKKLYEGDDLEDEVSKLTIDEKKKASDKLKSIYQLTGYSDPIFAEAFVDVHKFDIAVEVTVVNQTPETLQNVALELSTLGDLKLVERPTPVTIAPHDKKVIRTAMKVSSTESGTIFGNIVYDVAGAPSSDKNCVVLNEIHIDVMDYIVPANCTDLQFRKMWTEFEWENKVAVNTNIT